MEQADTTDDGASHIAAGNGCFIPETGVCYESSKRRLIRLAETRHVIFLTSLNFD
jgi:hypothetical protein